MATTSGDGAEIAISTEVPSYGPTATQTEKVAAFEALDWLVVGAPSSVPPADGRYDISTFENITKRTEDKAAGIFRAGNGTFNVAIDREDPSTNALEDNRGKRVSVRLSMTNGDVYYRRAIVTSFMPTNIAINTFLVAETGFEFLGETVIVRGGDAGAGGGGGV